MSAVVAPGFTAMCARQRSRPTGKTSITYDRPLMVSSKRTVFTGAGVAAIFVARVDCSVHAGQRKRSPMRSCTTWVRHEQFARRAAQKKSGMTESPQRFNDSSTGFPHLVGSEAEFAALPEPESARMGER
jgi:hypothetical protein